MGPSAESSMVEPWMNEPDAMTTSSSYPGIGAGTGAAKESTGAPNCMPRQKRQSFSGEPSSTICTMSDLGSMEPGLVL